VAVRAAVAKATAEGAKVVEVMREVVRARARRATAAAAATVAVVRDVATAGVAWVEGVTEEAMWAVGDWAVVEVDLEVEEMAADEAQGIVARWEMLEAMGKAEGRWAMGNATDRRPHTPRSNATSFWKPPRLG
jgi:hypothetical protein